jgi:hypothetical protein
MTVVFGQIGTPSILQSLVTSLPRMREFQSCRRPHSSVFAYDFGWLFGYTPVVTVGDRRQTVTGAHFEA